MNEKTKALDLSWNTIAKIALAVIAFYIFFQIKNILVWFLFAMVISILFNPAIDFLKKIKIPRPIGTILVYFGVFALITLVFYSAVIVLINEIDQFSKVFPLYLQKSSSFFRSLGIYVFEDIEIFIDATKSSLKEMTSAFFSASFAFFGGIFTTAFVLTTAFFLSLEGKAVDRGILFFFSKKNESYALSLWRRCQKKVGGWFFTRVLSCLFIGGAVYISSLILGIKYPFSFGLIAGVMNFVLYIGPLVSGALIFLVTAIDSLPKAIFILIIFSLAQLIESSVLMPVLSKKYIGLSPVLVIMSLSIGGILWGPLGAILAIPILGILSEFFKEFIEKRKKEEQLLIESQ